MENNGETLIIPLGRVATEGYYDYQTIRISQYNRIRDIIRRKIENIPMKTSEEKKEQKEYLEKFKDSEILKYLKQLEKQGKIQIYEHDYLAKLLEVAKETHQIEKKYDYKKFSGQLQKKHETKMTTLLEVAN